MTTNDDFGASLELMAEMDRVRQMSDDEFMAALDASTTTRSAPKHPNGPRQSGERYSGR